MVAIKTQITAADMVVRMPPRHVRASLATCSFVVSLPSDFYCTSWHTGGIISVNKKNEKHDHQLAPDGQDACGVQRDICDFCKGRFVRLAAARRVNAVHHACDRTSSLKKRNVLLCAPPPADGWIGSSCTRLSSFCWEGSVRRG